MEKYYITFRSVTYAQKGERILAAKGISCRLVRTPRWMEAKGCGYALITRELHGAIEALGEKNAAWEKVYRLNGREQPEEVAL